MGNERRWSALRIVFVAAVVAIIAVAAWFTLLGAVVAYCLWNPACRAPAEESGPPPPQEMPAPRGGWPCLNPFPQSLFLEPSQPVLLRLTKFERCAGPPQGEPLQAQVDANQTNGGSFGFIVKPHGEGVGFASVGQRVQGSLSAPGETGEFVFFARAARVVVVGVVGAVWEESDLRPVAAVRDERDIDLTGTGRSHAVEVPPEALVVEVSRGGVGTVVLRDPEGRTRARMEAAVEAWALADAAGAWTVACEDACAGTFRVAIISYRAP